MKTSDATSEWSLLQEQFDSYEKYSLIIKLFSIGILSVAFILENPDCFLFPLLLVLWLQDAIWKTFQSRIETRLLQVEEFLSGIDLSENESPDNSKFVPYQFNREWLKSRPSSINLIIEYAKHAFRPTIAFPHVVLVSILGIKLFL